MSNRKPGHTTGGSGRGGAPRSGRQRVGPPMRQPSSCPPGHRRQLCQHFFGSTNKRNLIQTDGGTQRAADPRFNRGTTAALRFLVADHWIVDYLSLQPLIMQGMSGKFYTAPSTAGPRIAAPFTPPKAGFRLIVLPQNRQVLWISKRSVVP